MAASLGVPEIARRPTLPENLSIVDVTPREAEQSRGVVLSADAKLNLSRVSAEAGIRRIQIGIPGQRERDKTAAAQAVAALPEAEIETLALAFLPHWQEEIAACAATNCHRINVVCRSSDRLQRVSGLTREAASSRVREAVSLARETAT